MEHPQSVERLWLARLRWRMRGAWLWPAFFGFTFVDGILIWRLPPYEGAPPGLVGGWLLAGFANLLLIAVAAPLAAVALRRRRRDLPQLIATDYTGTALTAALALLVLVAGLAHRPAVAAEADREAAVSGAVRTYVRAHEPDWAPGVAAVDVLRLERDAYRACVPGFEPRRALCLFVDTDRTPPRVRRDDSMEPNHVFRSVGGFR